MPTSSEYVSLAQQLGQAMQEHPETLTEALPRLEAVLAETQDSAVLAAVLEALDFAADRRALAVILEHFDRNHGEPDVRLAIARALPFVGPEPVSRRVLEALISLSRDDDPRVRDWACFGLGQLEADTPSVRDALADRLDDPHDDTRCEALLALARTGDRRARDLLLTVLSGDSDSVWALQIQAATALADPVLHPALEQLSVTWADDEDAFTELLATALKRCHPAAAARAAVVEQELLARVNEVLPEAGADAELVGAYPRTSLQINHSGDGNAVLAWDGVWDGEEPWSLPLEQIAQSFNFSYGKPVRD
jgi:hypothetical protein